MHRMHIHVGVKDLTASISFYTALFGASPTKTEPDYAKWMLNDPRLNFAISTHGGKQGINHLGLQVDEESELDDLRGRLTAADMKLFDEGETVCCYAHSDKAWVEDPSGIAWEAFRTMGEARMYSQKPITADAEQACCTPAEDSTVTHSRSNSSPSDCCP